MNRWKITWSECFQRRKASSYSPASVLREVRHIPLPQANFHSESLGYRPPFSSGRGAADVQFCISEVPRGIFGGYKMASQKPGFKLMGLAVLLILTVLRDVSGGSQIHKIFKKRDVAAAVAGDPPSDTSISVPSSKAQEFLAKLSRTKRNIWDRSRPDVQQWIMQFMHMGFDEQRLEADLSYWMDHARSSDQGRQHHYDENSPVGPRDPSSYRHGANVNYDYY
ncbi:unnamed protein product [Menidia menidia]|uniref:(Atlantic silverside) hypothetical protein n=1 Tax=Menidia menidia TaxID=238744 RepID=A0A8S4AJQ4_9TELE|nr:unnamed protein product [Menidia menidia]